MNRPTIASGILAAFGIALAAWVGWPVIQGLFPWSFEAPLMVGMVSALYGGYLLTMSEDRAGKALLVVIGIAITAATLITPMRDATLLGLHGLWLWGIRSLCFQRSFVGASLDGLLLAVGAGAALMVAQWTQGTFLPVWTMFLLQALFVCIPTSFTSKPTVATEEDRFARSQRMAEAAIKQIVTR